MKIKFMVAATLMAALVTTTSCGNSNKQSQSEKTEQVWGIKRSDLFVGRANDVKRFAVQ